MLRVTTTFSKVLFTPISTAQVRCDEKGCAGASPLRAVDSANDHFGIGMLRAEMATAGWSHRFKGSLRKDVCPLHRAQA